MADGKFVEVDKNMIVETNIKEPDIRFFNVREDPFEIYGLYEPKTETVFKRLPDEIGLNVNDGVKRLYLCTAGGRVRFSTDSRYVAIKCMMPYVSKYDHMPITNYAGFDLYIDGEEGCVGENCGVGFGGGSDRGGSISRYYRPFRPGNGITNGYEAVIKFADRKNRYLTINFPTYNPVERLYIGLQADAVVGQGQKYSSPLPVVYYGSSITQGACASHPGNTYESIISRRMNLDFINLGFSGSGRGEEIIADYMASLKMLAYVCDYDHNAPNAEYLAQTHCRLYKIIRAKNPEIPYIMLSRPDYDINAAESIARRDVIIDTYRYARSTGDKSVYYIDGEGIFRGPEEDLCTIDGSHPTDVGFLKMADAVERILVRALRKTEF